MITNRPRVLVAGIGGASLGTEILKCLLLADRYSIFGCDISRMAYGHYQAGFDKTFVIDRHHYIGSLLKICDDISIDVIIPGGEEPLRLLIDAANELASRSITLAANSPFIVSQFSDKEAAFRNLANRGILMPHTVAVSASSDLGIMTFPCIVKPATSSGGSTFVFLASTKDEALLYSGYLVSHGQKVIAQEYIPEDDGEFTVGVLSLPNGELVGSVALKRSFDSKLSIVARGKGGLVSSGYSQGLIDQFPEICSDAEDIAARIGSRGPLNIQGRVKEGQLVPFEINPRFSASTYLRAMAGFNEVDLYIRSVMGESVDDPIRIRPGYYLRSFAEQFVPVDVVKQ